jgi:hypothetical protein
MPWSSICKKCNKTKHSKRRYDRTGSLQSSLVNFRIFKLFGLDICDTKYSPSENCHPGVIKKKHCLHCVHFLGFVFSKLVSCVEFLEARNHTHTAQHHIHFTCNSSFPFLGFVADVVHTWHFLIAFFWQEMLGTWSGKWQSVRHWGISPFEHLPPPGDVIYVFSRRPLMTLIWKSGCNITFSFCIS